MYLKIIFWKTPRRKKELVYIFGETSCIVLLYLPINTYTSEKWPKCDWIALIAGDDEHVRCSDVRKFSLPFYQRGRERNPQTE